MASQGVADFAFLLVSTILQLHLGLQLAVALGTWAAGANSQLKDKLEKFQWQAILRAALSAAGPGSLLSAFALIQLRGNTLSSFTLSAMSVVGSAMVLSTFTAMVAPLCDGEVPEVDIATGDVFPKHSESRILKILVKSLSICKCIGYFLLVSAPVPMVTGITGVCASALARVGFVAQAVFGILYSAGQEESVLANVCADAAHVLHAVGLLAGLIVLRPQTTEELTVPDAFAILFLFCVVGLIAKVALVAMLNLACGGGVLEDSGAHKRISSIHSWCNGIFTLGMLSCVTVLSLGSFKVSIFDRFSGFELVWGPPLQAIALVIAGMAGCTQILEWLAPEPPQDSENDDTISKPTYQAGIYEPMKAITSRSSVLILALVALQSAPTPKADIDEEGSFWSIFSAFSSFCFLPCVVAMALQICMLLTFVVSNTDAAAEPIVDSMGTIAVEPESSDAAAMVRSLRSAASILMIMGLFFGIVSMGVLPWIVIGLVFIAAAFPLLPKTGKANVFEAISILLLMLQACTGVIGEMFEAQYSKMMERARAESDMKAAELDAEEAKAEEKKIRSETGNFKKKQPFAAAKKANKKKTM